jgi:Skp family chaperone for outer membrane proteins
MNVRSRGILAALVVLVAAAPLSAQARFGFVDTRKILQEMPARAAVEARLRTEIEALGAREKKMIDSLNVMVAAFEKDSSTLTPENRTKRFAALQAYDAQYRDTLQALQTEAQEKQAAAMQPLFDQVKLALDEVRAADGLAFIFDISAQGNSIVAMDKNLDVSDKVIARLRTQPAAPAARPAPQPAPTRPAPAGPVSQPAGVRKP